MTAQGWSVIIGAIGAALAVVIAALMPYLLHQVSKVHQLVNSQHDALVTYIGVLTTALDSAGVTVPQPTKAAVSAAEPEVPS